MAKTRKMVTTFLVTVVMTVLFFVSAFFSGYKANGEMTISEKVFQDAERTLKGFLSMEGEEPQETVNAVMPEEETALDRTEFEKDELKKNKTGRLTQRVTVISNNGILPISGTVAKIQDAFYPETYEVSFNTDFDRYIESTIIVNIPIAKGEKMYILTGDKENGYNQYQVVQAMADNYVSFSADVIRTYTLSKTDIYSAQEAMKDLAKAK